MARKRNLTERLKNWRVTAIAHVWPANDQIEHALFGYGCACGAEVEVVADGYLIKHNALDGRKDAPPVSDSNE